MKHFPLKGLAFATTALAPLLLGSLGAAASTLPTGGKVVAGSAVIWSPSGGSLAITQSSGKAIIDWNGFSIGQGGAVAFNNGRGATLNRVTGGSISSLDGLLTATGSVYVVNPNGVIVGRSGVVNVGGAFVASTLDVSNAHFLAGGALSFTGGSNAAVVNYGRIGALGGDVALIAARVSNAGEIDAARGDAGLLAGYKVVLSDASLDDGRFAVELGGAGTSATNAGLIQAADAELRAEGGNVYALAGDTAGVIRATGVSTGGGHVWLVADGGTLDVAGTLEAQGAGGTAGSIETSGQTVEVGAAKIDAHGGSWLVDPDDLTIDATAATTIDNALDAGTSVTEQTTATGTSGAGTVNTAGNGDIIVAAPLTWTTNAALTLSALRDVTLNPASLITSTGGGAVTLQADNTGTGVGTVNFGLASGVSTSGAVTIFYNPVSYNDAATKSTQSYGGGGQDSRNYANPYTRDVSGGGTLLAYMLVNNLTQLEGLSTELDGVYALTHDLDATSSATMNPNEGGGFAGWTPIGTPTSNNNGAPFTGTLNGQGHVIDGLYINSTIYETGLFGALGDPALISNLGVANANVTGTADANGILAGASTGATTLTNVYTTGTISGFSDTGGLLGKGGAYISNSYSTAAVSGGGSTGGLAGNESGALTNVYATGVVTGTSQSVGGLVGYFTGALTNGYATGAVSETSGGDVGGLLGQSGGAVTNAYATGSVTDTGGGDQNAGGLIGVASGNGNGPLTYQNIYATGAVTSAGGQVGGLIGYTLDSAIVTDAFATGAVTAAGPRVGGLIGINDGTLSQSYAAGAVTGSGDVGGLVGFNSFYPASGTITDSYATGSVTGVQSSDSSVINYIGGLVGTNNHYPDVNNPAEGAITRSYATGLVSGVGALGGLVGGNSGAITNAIWDRTSTGQANGVGVTLLIDNNGTATDTSTVTNLTSVQDTTPGAADYAFSITPYINAGFQFGTQPGGFLGTDGPSQTWVQVDTDGSFNGANGATVGTRPLLLMEYNTTISNAHQLQLIELAPAANYTLSQSVNASGTAGGSDVWGATYGFISLGTSQTPVSGAVNGQGFAISGLTIHNLSDTDAGLFRDFTNVVENVTLVGGTVTNTGAGYTGSLVGFLDGASASVINSASSATVAGQAVGGLVGVSQGAIVNSSASGTVTQIAVANADEQYAGGLVGFADGGVLTNDFASGAVSGTSSGIGGLAGESYAAITGSHAAGAVTGASDTGGLVGFAEGSIATSYATGSVTSTNFDVGGLVGFSAGTISDSYATGAVSGMGFVGGLAGVNQDTITGTITGTTGTTYATGAVSAPTDGMGLVGQAVGGLVGLDSTSGGEGGTTPGSITGAYATGAVSGTTLVGGLVGSNSGHAARIDGPATVDGTFATGAVTASGSNAGGLIGQNTAGIVTDSYATGNVSGAGDVGGLVGSSLNNSDNSGDTVISSISGSAPGKTYASGSITGSGTSTGGLVGENQGTITLASYTNAGSGVQGAADVGGAVGLNDAGASLFNVSVTGSVLGMSYTGGVAGDNFGSVSNVSFDGSVSGGGGVGGLAGVNEGGAILAGTVGANLATTVSGTGDDVGGVAGASFAAVEGAESFADVTGRDDVGGMVGYNAADVIGSSHGAVSGRDYVGGAMGLNYGSLNVDASGVVIGRDYVGGLVGFNYGTISGSQAQGGVTGTEYVGGLAGWNDASLTSSGAPGSISESSADGAVTATAGTTPGSGNYVGGLVGVNQGAITTSYAGSAAVNGAGLVGGLVGLNRGTLSASFTGAPTTGDLYVGGLVGWNDTGATIKTSYATGSVTGLPAGAEAGTNNDYVGGLVGVNFGAIADTYAIGAVSGVQVVGGLIGTNMPGASVATSYATGAVSASLGAVGTSFGVQAGEVTDVYGFPSLSGQPSETGYYNAGATGDGIDLTPAQEDGSAAYVGFDFTNIWQSNPDGPPTLPPPAQPGA